MSKNISNHIEYSYNTNNQNNNDFKESISKSFDETKHNISRSLDESKTEIPRYNAIVNSYQEQSLQTTKEISENYIESQKDIINSIQSAWKPYNEIFVKVVNSWNSPDSIIKAYSRFVSNVADNAVSAVRLSNNIIFSNLDSWKSGLHQAKENSRHILNQNVNAAKTFEHNTKELASAVQDANINSNTETAKYTIQSNKKI